MLGVYIYRGKKRDIASLCLCVLKLYGFPAMLGRKMDAGGNMFMKAADKYFADSANCGYYICRQAVWRMLL